MSRECLQFAVYIAMSLAIGDAIGRGKTPTAVPNMVIHYFQRH